MTKPQAIALTLMLIGTICLYVAGASWLALIGTLITVVYAAVVELTQDER